MSRYCTFILGCTTGAYILRIAEFCEEDIRQEYLGEHDVVKTKHLQFGKWYFNVCEKCNTIKRFMRLFMLINVNGCIMWALQTTYSHWIWWADRRIQRLADCGKEFSKAFSMAQTVESKDDEKKDEENGKFTAISFHEGEKCAFDDVISMS